MSSRTCFAGWFGVLASGRLSSKDGCVGVRSGSASAGGGWFCIGLYVSEGGACFLFSSWRCSMSVSIVIAGLGGTTGMNLRRNFRFRVVIFPDPSIFTTYWSNCRTSVTVPVLSHLFGCKPLWFCTRTLSPTANGGNRRVCSDHFSCRRI